MEFSRKTVGEIIGEVSNLKEEVLEKNINEFADLIHERSDGKMPKAICYIKAKTGLCWAKECYLQFKDKTLGEMADNVISAYNI